MMFPFPAPRSTASAVAVMEQPLAAPAVATVPDLPEIATAAELERQAVGDGYVAGFSPFVPAAARQVDLDMVRRMRCPACHRRGLEARPYQRVADRGYRLVCACPKCGAGEIA